jgi:outer membrane protein assembly factor BamA
LGIRYSQYAKIDGDFRYYLKTGPQSKLAARIFVGIGIPNGNSSELPFIKQYFAGGSNSIRAFLARSVGPGTYKLNKPNLNSFNPDQSGDIKLEVNIEYRKKLYRFIHGAVFIDAGNVWLYNHNANKPGAKFSKMFLKELAVGTGLGLRFDLSFLILRTDFAFPIRKPWLASGDRWVFNQINFGSKQWLKENLIFNLAIGYPF